MAYTLIEHRKKLANNTNAYTYDIEKNTERVCKTLIPYLKKAGYKKVTFKKSKNILENMIRLIFATQDERPIFYIEGTQLPLCWNSPKDWKLNYIKYEWGHILSYNQNPNKANNVENLGLYSARCNKHIQSSMDIQELMIYGGVLAQRVSNVLLKRRLLFVSEEWKNCIDQL